MLVGELDRVQVSWFMCLLFFIFFSVLTSGKYDVKIWKDKLRTLMSYLTSPFYLLISDFEKIKFFPNLFFLILWNIVFLI